MCLNFSVYHQFVDIHLLIEYNRYYWLEYKSMNWSFVTGKGMYQVYLSQK